MLQTVCMAGKNGLRLLVLPDWLFSGSMVQRSGSWLLAQKVVMVYVRLSRWLALVLVFLVHVFSVIPLLSLLTFYSFA